MKKLIWGIIFIALLAQFSQTQNLDHIEGGRFLKKTEYNIVIPGVTEADNSYNLEGKSSLDRIFFGEINSPVEFVLRTSFEGASALRLIRTDTICEIEVMNLPESEEIIRIMAGYENPVVIPGKLLSATSLTLNDMSIISEHNKAMRHAKQSGELYKPYRPESYTFRVSQQFAEKFYNKMVLLIDNFKSAGIPPIILDGDEVTFRCVVENELWTLIIHVPQNRALKLSNLCRQIITDITKNELNEPIYSELLDEVIL